MRCFSTILLILLTSTIYFSCTEQGNEKYFSGTIEYTYSYSSATLNADSITTTRPAKGIFRFDEDDYQSQFLGKDTLTYYYSGKLNKAVGKTGGKSECEDYGVATDSVLTFKLYETDEKILGYACRVLELQKRNSLVKYYVSKELKIAPGTYQKHRAYNWNVYGEKAKGGLILKLEHRFKTFTMHGAALKINEASKNFSALELREEDFVNICKTLNSN